MGRVIAVAVALVACLAPAAQAATQPLQGPGFRTRVPAGWQAAPKKEKGVADAGHSALRTVLRGWHWRYPAKPFKRIAAPGADAAERARPADPANIARRGINERRTRASRSAARPAP
jgi:hypothetical protein